MHGLFERLDHLQLRPKMFGLDGGYADYVKFLQGYDCAAGDAHAGIAPLDGFSEWLAGQLGYGSNLVWTVLVLRIALPDVPDPFPMMQLKATRSRQPCAL